MFVTISKFGALNCALIGLIRKMLSLVLSFVLYGHTLNTIQSIGLLLAIVAMVANFYDKGGGKGGHGHGASKPKRDATEIELGGADANEVKEDELPLMIEETEPNEAGDKV